MGRFGGGFAQQTPASLAARVIAEVVARTGIAPARVDEVILGHAYPSADAPPSAGSPHWTPGSRTPSPAPRSTGAAAPVCRPSWTRPCRSGPDSATS
ncbi:hypothetical protein NKH18_41435 [Streptomyces sp. M10(2022)]